MKTTTTIATEPASPPRLGLTLTRSGVRWWSLGAGVTMVVAGLVLLGYVGWEYYGTDVVATGRQSDLRAEIHARWDYPTVTDVLGPKSAVTALGSADALVRIPAFGLDYETPLIEGVRDEDLKNGIGHFPGAGPGQIGNFALGGYQVTHGEPFRDLPKLRPGDRVIVETAEATYTYELDTDPNDLVVPFSDNWVIDPVPMAPDGEAPPGMPRFEAGIQPTEAILTLTTCSELFHSDNRLVAFGHLLSTVPK